MKKIVIGNLKMNFLSSEEAGEYVSAFAALCKERLPKDVQAVLCPPFVHLETFGALQDCGVALGAQNVFWEDSGAFTGEISPAMLRNAGVTFVLVGHSERRTHLGETDDMVGKKVSSALDAGLTPVVCIGDALEDRSADKHFERVEEQLRASIAQCTKEDCEKAIFVYEPVWAISSNRAADSPNITGDDILSMKTHMKKILTEICGRDGAQAARVIYGGSVDAKNAAEVCLGPGMDGGLPGRASLDPEEFMSVLEAFSTKNSA